MGIFGQGNEHKLKNAMSSSSTATNTAMSGSTTKQRTEAKAKAKTVMKGNITATGSSTVKVMSKAEVQQEVIAMKQQTNIMELENDILSDLEQKPTADITGGMFAPDVTSDNSLNISTTAATASANYSYMSVSVLATADADLEFFGNIVASDNAKVELGAVAKIKQEVTMSQEEVVSQSGLNTLTTMAEQAPSVTVRDPVVEGMKVIADTINNAVNALAGLLGGPFMIVAALIGLAVVARLSGGGDDGEISASEAVGRNMTPEQVQVANAKARSRKWLWRGLGAFVTACVVLLVVAYAHDIWESDFNLLKYPAKWLGLGIAAIPLNWWWIITLIYGSATVGLHVLFIRT